MPEDLPPIQTADAKTSRMIALGLGSAWAQFGLSLIISFLRYALLFRYLPQSDLGLGVLMLTAAQFLLIFDSALAPVITTEVGRAWNNGLPSSVVSSCRYVYRRVFVLLIAASALTLPVMLFMAKDYSGYPVLISLWVMFAIRACAGFLSAGKFHVLTGSGWYYAGKTGQFAGDPASFGALFLFLQLGAGVLSIGAAALAECCIQWIIASWFFAKRIGRKFESLPDKEIVRRIRDSAIALLGNAVGVFLVFNTDSFFIARYVGLGAVADYGIAYRLVFLISTFCNPFYNIIYPRFVNDLRHSNPEGIRGFYGLVRLNHILASAMGLGILLLGNRIIDIWVGPGHFIGIGIVSLLVVSSVLDNINYPDGYTFLSKNRPRIIMYNALAAGVANLIFTGILAPRYGAIGVAAGTLIAQALFTYVPLTFLSLRALNWRFTTYLQQTILPVALLWVAAGAYLLLR